MYKNGERMMAWIVTIEGIKSIPDADKIEVYCVGGWEVVGQKDSFSIGQLAVYCSIDSWIPTELAPFLTKGKEPREYNGVKGERLKTIKLRGQVSQGLLLPLSDIKIKWQGFTNEDFDTARIEDGLDVTELLGIQKWERPMDTHLAGICKGNFPSWIRKTDQERCISGETLIDTEYGLKTIKEIVENKLKICVASFNHVLNIIEYNPIINWSVMKKRNNWIKITTKSGKTLICTNNHKIWCEDIKAYRLASDIQIGQFLVVKN